MTGVLAVSLVLLCVGCSPGHRARAATSTTTTRAVPVTRSTGCGKAPDVPTIASTRPGDVAADLTSGGEQRTYRLSVPARYRPDRPAPLIVNLHGSGSNALQASVYSDLPRAAAARGVLVVTPDAHGGKWQLGPTGSDATFLGDLVDDIEARYCIDLARVHLAGMSLGAWKAAITACSSGDRYASMALVAVEIEPGSCPPIPVVAFHGTADPVVAYGAGGGSVDAAATPNKGVPGTLGNIANWARREGCAKKPVISTIGNDVRLRRYVRCDQGGAVELYTIVGGGHTWPGSSIDLGDPSFTTHTIDANQIVLDWFAAHPRRR